MNKYIKKEGQRQVKEKYRVIYTPSGAAREYSELAVNLATGCEHGCKYCYAPSIRRTSREDFKTRIIPRNNFNKNLELDLKEMSELQDARRVLLCFMTDAYQPLLAKETRNHLKQFRKYDIAFQVLTKNGKLAEKDFDLYSKKDAYASTIIFSDEATRKYYEPAAGTLKERIDSLKKAKELGIETWVSLEPVIIPEQALEVIELTKDFTDHYKVGKINNYDTGIKVDWHKFTRDAIDKLEKYDKSYYIKDSLRPFIK